jgi:hypothetical protein
VYLPLSILNPAGDLLVFGAIILIGVFIIKNLYFLLYNYTQSRFIWLRFASIGSNLFRHYMNAPYEFHLSQEFGPVAAECYPGNEIPGQKCFDAIDIDSQRPGVDNWHICDAVMARTFEYFACVL